LEVRERRAMRLKKVRDGGGSEGSAENGKK
jgi:hypothetical protein